jgi:hypothetical protein
VNGITDNEKQIGPDLFINEIMKFIVWNSEKEQKRSINHDNDIPH